MFEVKQISVIQDVPQRPAAYPLLIKHVLSE
jgi:hypothetical protein